MCENNSEVQNLIVIFTRLTNALEAKVNTKEYNDVKKQMSTVEANALKLLQQSRSILKHTENKINGHAKAVPRKSKQLVDLQEYVNMNLNTACENSNETNEAQRQEVPETICEFSNQETIN